MMKIVQCKIQHSLDNVFILGTFSFEKTSVACLTTNMDETHNLQKDFQTGWCLFLPMNYYKPVFGC